IRAGAVRGEAQVPKIAARQKLSHGQSRETAKTLHPPDPLSRPVRPAGYSRSICACASPLVWRCPMPVEVKRRVVLAARPSEVPQFAATFAHASMQGWQSLVADSLERCRSLVQHQLCDVLMVDECMYQRAGPSGLSWLARQREFPAVLLTGMEPEVLAVAYGEGLSVCLPRRQTLEHPPLLAAALDRAAHLQENWHTHRRTKEGLHQCRRQVDRLVSLL